MKICRHWKWETMDNNGCHTHLLVMGYVGKRIIMVLMFSLFGNNEIDDLKQPVKTSLRSVFSWLFSVINFIIPSKLNINTLLWEFLGKKMKKWRAYFAFPFWDIPILSVFFVWFHQWWLGLMKSDEPECCSMCMCDVRYFTVRKLLNALFYCLDNHQSHCVIKWALIMWFHMS